MPWGSHCCHFFQTRQDLLETLLPYFKVGLEARELCVWIIHEPLTEAAARRALRQAVPGADRYLADGSLEIVSIGEWYLKGGRFSLKRVMRAWDARLEQAGPRFFRDESQWQYLVGNACGVGPPAGSPRLRRPPFSAYAVNSRNNRPGRPQAGMTPRSSTVRTPLTHRRRRQRPERLIVEDVETDPGFGPHRPIAAAAGFRAVQSTPLLSRGAARRDLDALPPATRFIGARPQVDGFLCQTGYRDRSSNAGGPMKLCAEARSSSGCSRKPFHTRCGGISPTTR